MLPRGAGAGTAGRPPPVGGAPPSERQVRPYHEAAVRAGAGRPPAAQQRGPLPEADEAVAARGRSSRHAAPTVPARAGGPLRTSTVRDRPSAERSTRTVTRASGACFRTLLRASCTMRNAAASTAAGYAPSCGPAAPAAAR